MLKQKTDERARNYIKAMLFDDPDWIPCNVSIMPATWIKYGEAVEEIVLEHPRLFPDYQEGAFRNASVPPQYRKGRWVDVWGTVWENIEEGLDSIPVEEEAPLRDWSALETYVPPDPIERTDLLGEPIDWDERARTLQEVKERGGLARGGLSHGFMFMRLFYLRGYSNLMIDIATHDPRLDQLIAIVRDYNVRLVRKWLDLGVELMHGGDDMGMQTSLPISPQDWRRYIKPCYAAIVGECRGRGVPFHLHSDGRVVDIIPDLVECGVTAINPQVRANGLEDLRRVAKGNVCVDLDLDRQLFPFASISEVREHIQSAIETLNTPRGGLMIHAECEPDVPLPTIRAIVETLEQCGCGPK
ncbi:MAG: uroporphyrinogen decarboxylase family protein [Anaerolineae bacterium]|jgi:uroporphyrinogen decarboxylase